MEQREKLIELMLKCNADNELFDCFEDRPRYRQAAEILADYLIANGVVALPCRIGDTVFRINKNFHTHVLSISETKVSRVAIDSEGTWVFCECIPTSKSKFGEIVFLTKEEAEKELAKRKGGDG